MHLSCRVENLTAIHISFIQPEWAGLFRCHARTPQWVRRVPDLTPSTLMEEVLVSAGFTRPEPGQMPWGWRSPMLFGAAACAVPVHSAFGFPGGLSGCLRGCRAGHHAGRCAACHAGRHAARHGVYPLASWEPYTEICHTPTQSATVTQA